MENPNSDTWLTAKEVCDMLHVSKAFLSINRQKGGENLIPYHIIGDSMIRYSKSDVETYLKRQRHS